MTVRKRTLIVIGLILACSILVSYVTSNILLRNSFVGLEAQDVHQDVQRALSVLANERLTLDAMAFDWGSWDDTYAFIQDANDDYVQSNLVDGTFTSLRLNLMLFVHSSGRIVFGKGFDLHSGKEIPIPQSLKEHTTGDALLLHHPHAQSNISGVILLPQAPMLVASRPIVTRKEGGSIRGTLILGRYLDSDEIERLAGTARLSLAIHRVDDPRIPSDFDAALSSLSVKTPVFVRPLSAESVAGYSLIEDIYGEPALVLRVDTSRGMYKQGLATIRVYAAWLLAVGLVFGAMTLWFLERLVLSRLAHLSASVGDIGISSDLSARVSITGEDELSSLANAINGMLEALERSQRGLRESEERLRTVVQNMPAMMVAFDEKGDIIVWNQECERVTGYSANEIVGNVKAMELLGKFVCSERGLIAPDAMPTAVQTRLPGHRNRVIVEWFRRGYNFRDWEWRVTCKDGSVKTVAWSNISQQFPIPGWGAWGIGVDVSERVRAQERLRQSLTEQEALFAIGQLISSSLQVDEVMQLVAEHMAHLVDAAGCIISDWDSKADTLTTRAKYVRPDRVQPGYATEEIGQSFAVSRYPVIASAIQERKPYVKPTAWGRAEDESWERCLPQNLVHEANLVREARAAVVPIIARAQVTGVAQVFQAKNDPPFTPHDLRLLQTLAGQVGVAIENARLFSVVQADEAAMRNMSLRLLQVQEQERRHIAQELHDELGQLLTAIKINVDLAQRKLRDKSAFADKVTSLRRRLGEASKLTDDVLTSVRAMTVELRPALLDEMGIVPALRWYLKRFAQRTGIQVQLEANLVREAQELDARPRPEIETTIYRVVQEALTNVARHALASQVQIRLARSDDRVVVSIQDDGRGFDVEAWAARQTGQTLGLAGIRERVMLLNGQVTIESQPGEGTRIEIELPARFRPEGDNGTVESVAGRRSRHRTPGDQVVAGRGT